jgi:hypothetical protein
MKNPFHAVKEKIEVEIITKLIAGLIERSCKSYITTIVGALGVALFAYNTFAAAIPAQYQATVNFVAVIVMGVALALAHDSKLPTDNIPSVTKLSAILLVVGLLALPVHAQTVSPVTPGPNFAAGGASYSVSASSPVAGTFLMARPMTDGTYAFAVYDVVPSSLNPIIVTNNIGLGVGQRVYTAGRVQFFVPTAAGISWTGDNVGWAWNTGGMASIDVKGWKLMPDVRVFKSSVAGTSPSGGTGYQLIPGFMVGKQF